MEIRIIESQHWRSVNSAHYSKLHSTHVKQHNNFFSAHVYVLYSCTLIYIATAKLNLTMHCTSKYPIFS